MKALLNENSLTVRGGSIGASDEFIQLIEICLGEVARADTAGVFDRDGNDSALFVLSDFCEARQTFRGIDAVALVVDMLKIKARDEVIADGPAAQQVFKKCGGGMAADEAAGKPAERSEASGVGSKCGQHHCPGTLLVGRHNACGGFVLF